MLAKWKTKARDRVLEHGANPGLISHWTKRGLLDIAAAVVAEKKVTGAKAAKIAALAKSQTFNELAMELGVKVIHCSERDTQISDVPKAVDEFVNTWSFEGFREEGITTGKWAGATHEKQLPPLAYEHKSGPKNQICLARMGMEHTRAHLGAELHGRRHGGAPRRGFHDQRLPDGLEERQGGLPPDDALRVLPVRRAIISLHELRGRNYSCSPSCASWATRSRRVPTSSAR